MLMISERNHSICIQLAKMAEDLRTGGVKIPVNLIVTGTITSTGDISSASYSLSGLNTSIDATNTALTATDKDVTAINKDVTATNTNLTTTLKDYVKYNDNIRITNRGSGAEEYGEPYIGISGYTHGKINVSMNTDSTITR